MTKLIATLCTAFALLVALPRGGAAQLQPLQADDPAARFVAGLIEPMLAGDEAARAYLLRHAAPEANRDSLKLLLGSDALQLWNVPGASIQHELQMVVEAGLTPFQALETGTRNPALFFGTDEWGTIAPGKVADLILLEANPLQDIAHLSRRAGVMVRGTWLPEAEIQARLATIEAAVAAAGT